MKPNGSRLPSLGKNVGLPFQPLRYKRTVRWLGASAFGLMICFGTLAVYQSQDRNEALLTTLSPAGTYTVTLTGQKDRPLLPMVDHSVRLDVIKHGKPLFAGRKLYSGDWLDASFNEWYPDHRWVSEQSVQFYREAFRRDFPNDNLTVKNNSGKKIAMLKVVSVDILIIFELNPQSTATFSVSRARADSKWTAVEGEFEGGQPLTDFGMDFDVTKEPGPHYFLITISENGTTMTSR